MHTAFSIPKPSPAAKKRAAATRAQVADARDRVTIALPALLTVAEVAAALREYNCSTGDINCPNKAAYAANELATFTVTGVNVGQLNPPSTYTGVENEIMAEAANCPQPADPATCPFAENTGYFINLENSKVVWFGLAEAFGGLNTSPGGPNVDYYDQELALPNKNGFAVNSRFRTVQPVP